MRHRRPSFCNLNFDSRARSTDAASLAWAEGKARRLLWAPGCTMVYLRGGTVVQEPSAIDRVLSFPYRIYEFIMFFIMTLIDVRSPPGSCQEKNVRPFPCANKVVIQMQCPSYHVTPCVCSLLTAQSG